MYQWVLEFIAIILICILIYLIYLLRPSEGFIVATPPEEYSPPELRGVQGRYIRIRPSKTHGDGYLSISQIQVIDVNNENVALGASVFATSTGGSPLDKQYGRAISNGGAFTLVPGVGAPPSSVTDGQKLPRYNLVNTFQTSNQNYCPENTNAPDTEYLEIDLSGEYIIKNIIYTGRANPINTTFDTFQGTIRVDQVSRLTNMRLEIYNTTRTLVLGEENPYHLFSDDPSTHLTLINLDMPFITINRGGGSVLQTVSFPDITTYENFVKPFRRYPDINNLANQSLMDNFNKIYSTLSYPFDVNEGLFSLLASQSPLNFYTDIYSPTCSTGSHNYCKPNYNCCDLANTTNCQLSISRNPFKAVTSLSAKTLGIEQQGTCSGPGLQIPPTPSTIQVQIFGVASTASINEMTLSQKYCSKLFLGSPQYVENYIRVSYDTSVGNIKAYLRADNTNKLCMPDLKQVFENSEFTTKLVADNQTWNNTNCTTLIDSTLLSLLPDPTRKFIVNWISSRTKRYMSYATLVAGGDAESVERIPTMRLIPSRTQIDLTSVPLINRIAQQFYELLGGDFSMNYIYDIYTIGQTILDIRFELIVHTNQTIAYGPISYLKAQYDKFRSGGVKTHTEDIVNQGQLDYQNKLDTLEQENINNISNTFRGAVARIFYTPPTQENSFITITGMIFDDRAVTSFLPELNGGMNVPYGSLPGNINFKPTIVFTKNVTKDILTCSEQSTVRRIMDDYTNDVKLNKNILLKAANPIDTSLGNFFVNEVNSWAQISPTQCAFEWTESVYDPLTNVPIPFTSTGTNAGSSAGQNPNTIFRRFAILTYKKDSSSWQSPNLYYDPLGLKFLTSNTIPACSFDPETYRLSVGQRFSSLGTSSSDITTIKNDFITNAFKGGEAPICPQTLPGYVFNAADYRIANPTVSPTSNLIAHYISTNLSVPVRAATTTTAFPSRIIYNKPLPSQTNLDNNYGLCPKTSCDDLNVLYNLADQYNSDPSLPGFIMRIKRAFTPNPYQCDIEADISYDAMIQDIIGQKLIDPATGVPYMNYPTIRKGTVSYNVGSDRKTITQGSKSLSLTGIQTVKLALTTTADVATCNYILVDAGEANSGTSIQENTPYLYKFMEYVDTMSSLGSSIGSSIGNIQSDFTRVSGSAKTAAIKYRANTYAALGDINTLNVCPGKKCSDSDIMTSIRTMLAYELSSILHVGTATDRVSCDVTYTNTSNQTVAKRFTMQNSSSGCRPSVTTSITPTPTYDQIKNMSVPLNTANTYKQSGFTDYSPPPVNETHPLQSRSFGLDRARNSTDSLKDEQFKIPLEQVIPIKEDVPATESYRFLRFVPLKTRDANAESVGVSKFTFFYKEKALALTGKVTNPMGTWEGGLNDITGPGFREGWSDKHKSPLIFAFNSQILVDAYSFTTASKEIGCDPVAWKLEGSVNGSFWVILDTQRRFPTPVERFHEILPQPLTL